MAAPKTLSPSQAWPFPTGISPVSLASAPSKPVTGPATKRVTTPKAPTKSVAPVASSSIKRRSWKPQIAQLAALFYAGKTDAEIGEILDRTPKAITGQRGDAKSQNTKTGKLVAAEIARLGKAAKQPTAKPVNHNERWTAEADKVLLLAYIQGKTPEEQARVCGRTVPSVNGRLHALGVLIFNSSTKTYMTAPRIWMKVA